VLLVTKSFHLVPSDILRPKQMKFTFSDK